MNTQRLFTVLDRLAHQSTTGNDLENTVSGFRRILNGELPSQILADDNGFHPSTPRSYDDWQTDIATLKEKLKQVEREKSVSEREKTLHIKTLTTRLLKLQIQFDKAANLLPSNGHYSHLQWTQMIAIMFVKHHGVGKALVQKNAAQRQDGSDLPKITDSSLQKWRREDRYPEWAVAQLKRLTPDDLLKSHPWTADKKRFLYDLFDANPHLTNEQLAERCSRQFGYPITDSSMRGLLHRGGRLRPVKLLA